MKKVTAKHFYPFSTSTLIRAFNDADVIKAKLADSGAKDISIDIQESDNGFVSNIERTMPADVPSALKSLLGAWNQVNQSETWTGSVDSGFQCELKIDISDVPVTITGTMDINVSDILTTNIVEIEVSCGIPLIGGQLEKFVVANIEKSVAEEFEFLKAHLG